MRRDQTGPMSRFVIDAIVGHGPRKEACEGTTFGILVAPKRAGP